MTEPQDEDAVDAFNEGVAAATDAAAAAAVPDDTPPAAEPPPLTDLPDDVPDGDVEPEPNGPPE